MRDRKKHEKHEAQGIVKISHWSGRMNLFGTHVETYGGVSLEISECETEFDRISGRHYYPGKAVASINLSPVQFAELITTPNQGCGVPCTLEYYRDGETLKKCEPLPERTRSEAGEVREAFMEQINEKMASFKSIKRRIDSLLKKGAKMKAADREEIAGEIHSFMRLMGDSLPFAAKCFEEAADATVTAAKGEISSFADITAKQTGLAVLQEQAEQLQIEEEAGD